MKSIQRHLKDSNKKGQLGGLTGNLISLVVAIVVLVMGIVIVQEIRDTDIAGDNAANCNATTRAGCSEVYQAANASLVGLGDFSDFVPIIVIAVAASVIIGLILVGFAFSRRTR